MTIRKRRTPTPGFRLPPPYQPITGEQAPLSVKGVFPYVAMMQVAKEDIHDDYVICRGFDVRIARFVDYAEGDEDKPGIPVAKPYGRRRPGTYHIGQIFPAIIPLQTPNPSPVDVPWRVGQNPGWATGGMGHPQDLTEEVDFLRDDNDEYINWQLLDEGGNDLVEGCLAEDHPGYGVVFEITLQHWIPDNNGHSPNEPADLFKAIDWRYGMTYPDAGARGLFQRHTGYCGTEYVDMYEVVTLDCEPPPIDCTEAEVAVCAGA
jgi:hypothetical protein